MRLERVIIEGFRSYSDRTEVDISDMTAFIGENDVGKTSILEALDCFFNDTIDAQDFNAHDEKGKIIIGCVFSSLPEEVTIEAQSTTSLKDEYLLNYESNLEIYQEWSSHTAKPSLQRVYAHARAPANDEIKDLLLKNNAELKKIVEGNNISASKRDNSEMRTAIYKFFLDKGNLNLQMRDVELRGSGTGGSADGRKIWDNLKSRHLPIYSLFRSDQVQGDQEGAVRDPLNFALKLALRNLEEELSVVEKHVKNKVTETTMRTLERLRRDYPKAAQDLIPEFKNPDWFKAFSIDLLRSEHSIPLNKRGSGVRRLVVLAFFQAESERKRQEKSEEEDKDSVPVIYAIEEPETSQHPEFQRNIIEALISLSENGDQVILTTHVPGLAELLPISSIRFIEKSEGVMTPKVNNGRSDPEVLLKAADSLGVLPEVYPVGDAQIAVWVEGPTDVWALDGFAKAIQEAGEFPKNLDMNRIYYVFGGGCTQLKFAASGEYLDILGLPQLYLLDSDKKSASDPKSNIKEAVEYIEKRRTQGKDLQIEVVTTNKRQIENYVHPDAIRRIVGEDLELPSIDSDFDWDFGPIAKDDTVNGNQTVKCLWKIIQAGRSQSYRYPHKEIRGISVDGRNSKHVICGLFINSMTLSEIRERCKATNDADSDVSEVERWFRTMAEMASKFQK